MEPQVLPGQDKQYMLVLQEVPEEAQLGVVLLVQAILHPQLLVKVTTVEVLQMMAAQAAEVPAEWAHQLLLVQVLQGEPVHLVLLVVYRPLTQEAEAAEHMLEVEVEEVPGEVVREALQTQMVLLERITQVVAAVALEEAQMLPEQAPVAGQA